MANSEAERLFCHNYILKLAIVGIDEGNDETLQAAAIIFADERDSLGDSSLEDIAISRLVPVGSRFCLALELYDRRNIGVDCTANATLARKRISLPFAIRALPDQAR